MNFCDRHIENRATGNDLEFTESTCTKTGSSKAKQKQKNQKIAPITLFCLFILFRSRFILQYF